MSSAFSSSWYRKRSRSDSIPHPGHLSRSSGRHRPRLSPWGKFVVVCIVFGLVWTGRSPIQEGYHRLQRPFLVNNSFSSEHLKTTDQDEPRFVKDTDQDGELDMDEVGDGRSLQHHWEQNGKLAVELISFIHHPIWELIQDADDRWAASISTTPKTAADFLKYYELKFGISPPAHLDRLFEPSENTLPFFPSPLSLAPYLSIPSATLHARQNALEAQPLPSKDEEAFVIFVSDGHVGVDYPWSTSDSLKAIGDSLKKRLEPHRKLLPDLRLTFSHSSIVSPQIIPYDILDRSENIVSDKTYKAQYRDWAQVCAPEADLHRPSKRKYISPRSLTRADRQLDAYLIHHHALALDPCASPKLMWLHPTFGSDPPPSDIQPVPRMATSKLAIGAEMLLPFERINARASFVHWDNKLEKDAVFWRGTPPPLLSVDLTDESTILPQAYRLLAQTQNPLPQTFQRTFYPPSDPDDDQYGYYFGGQSLGKIGSTNQLWDTIGLVDGAFNDKVHCTGQAGCEDFAKLFPTKPKGESLSKHKYALILDGESPWEAMRSGTVVFYASAELQPWQDHALPWKHYVPVQPDFSDLASILLFFRRYDGEGRLMAENAAVFAKEYLQEDNQTKMVVAGLMEWGKIWGREQ